MTSTLLQLVNTTDSADHSIVITGATAGKTLLAFLVAPATIVLHADSVTAGWVQDAYSVNTIGCAVFRLDTTSNVGGSQTLRVTHNGSRVVAGAIIQSDCAGAPSTSALNETVGGGSLGSWSTTAATASDEEVFAVFASNFTSETNNLAVTSYDQGFTALADSLFDDSAAGENGQLFVAYKANGVLSAAAVTATLNQTISSLARVAGVMAYNTPTPPPAAWTWAYSGKIG
jgi:hypothetical protein